MKPTGPTGLFAFFIAFALCFMSWLTPLCEKISFTDAEAVPLGIPSYDGKVLHAWYISRIMSRGKETFYTREENSYVKYLERTLRQDPDSRLVLFFHGQDGTVASGRRADIHRALREKAHIITLDYRDQRRTTISKRRLTADGLAFIRWFLAKTAIPPERIVIFGEGFGSAVAISMMHKLKQEGDKMCFAGVVLGPGLDKAQVIDVQNFGLIPQETTQRDNLQQIKHLTNKTHKFHITLIHAEGRPNSSLARAIHMFRLAAIGASGETDYFGMDVNATLDGMFENSVSLDHGRVWGTVNGEIRLIDAGQGGENVTMHNTAKAVWTAFNGRTCL